MAVSLGGVVLDGFEAPAGFRFGGDQRLAVHSLPGGTRIVDAMGPDEADISWRGYLSGQDAANRARLLDSIRQAGAEVTLAWDDAFYLVVLSRIHFVYHSAWWIQCDVCCTVISVGAGANSTTLVAAVAQVAADLASAGDWIDVSAASAAVAATGAALPGTQAYASASLLLGRLGQQINSGIAAADAEMGAQDVPSLVAASGNLAGLAAARGYVGRAAINMANAGT